MPAVREVPPGTACARARGPAGAHQQRVRHVGGRARHPAQFRRVPARGVAPPTPAPREPVGPAGGAIRAHHDGMRTLIRELRRCVSRLRMAGMERDATIVGSFAAVVESWGVEPRPAQSVPSSAYSASVRPTAGPANTVPVPVRLSSSEHGSFRCMFLSRSYSPE